MAVKTITAKFNSTCPACGKYINAGDKVLWEPGEKAQHVNCSTAKATTPKSQSTTPKKTATTKKPTFFGEKTGIVRYFKSYSRPSEYDLGESLRSQKENTPEFGQVITCVGVEGHYWSQNAADDMDECGPSGSFEAHWDLTKYYRPATEAEIAKFVAAETALTQKKAEAVQAKEDEEAKLQAVYAAATELETQGLVRITAQIPGVTSAEETVVLSHRRSGGCKDYATLTKIGDRGYRLDYGNFDDWRTDYLVTPVNAEIAYQAARQEQAESAAKYNRTVDTPASAQTYLEKYSGCYGADYYVWLAKQPA